nr:GNAT family N-acetyltransferase [Chitinophaga pinensis]
MLPGNWSHSYIGEINGTPGYNFEVYWVVRDMLADYYDALQRIMVHISLLRR